MTCSDLKESPDMCTEMHAYTRKHTRTHSRVDSHYNVLIGWNLNNAQAKQSDSRPGRGCVSWNEADVFLVFWEDYRKLLNCCAGYHSVSAYELLSKFSFY